MSGHRRYQPFASDPVGAEVRRELAALALRNERVHLVARCGRYRVT
jgi:hypothetical protein